MLKETNKALELINNINCENLEDIKKELNNIVDNLKYETIVVTTSATNNNCVKERMRCIKNCNNQFDVQCNNDCISEFEKCKNLNT